MAVDMNMNVLIVDDYKTMLRILRNLLKQLNFNNIEDATDGSMALEVLRTKDIGMVISESLFWSSVMYLLSLLVSAIFSPIPFEKTCPTIPIPGAILIGARTEWSLIFFGP